MSDPGMQAKIGARLAEANAKRTKQITPDQATKNNDYDNRKHLFVTLRGEQTVAGVLETPEAWSGLSLSKADLVSVWSPDGLAMADSAMVVKSEAGKVWFSKPLRLVSFEPSILYTDGKHEVVSSGTGYAIKNLRDGSINYSQMFTTAKAAEHEIERRKPVTV